VPKTSSERFDEHVSDWQLAIESRIATETSLIAFGTRGDQSVVLKVVKNDGEEWRAGDILGAFEGHGLVRVLESADGAVLLERLLPGTKLVELSLNGKDDEATEIIAGIIGQMSAVQTRAPHTIHIADLVSGFQRHRHHCDGLMPISIVDKAEQTFHDLCASMGQTRLLHGDLHHANVLFDARHGWVAIDPWGLRGELECELSASLRNPISAPHLLRRHDLLERRLQIHEKLLGIDMNRALRWAFALTVLAALWPTLEDGVDMRVPFITAAKTMMAVAGM
jgi:streptomycin 6-kinase